MADLTWLDEHVGSIDDGIRLINQFYWNISIDNMDGVWFVFGGEKVLLRTSNRDEVNVFLYGMSLAYSIMPERYIEQFRKEFDPF